MKKFYGILFFLLISLSAGAVYAAESFRTPFSNRLENLIHGSAQVAQNPGMGRLNFMRYYPPSDEMPKEVGFWSNLFGWGETKAQAYCTALYLYNMYITTAAYGEDMPSRLTVDYLGALDAFGKCRSVYKAAEAEKFYGKNKAEIKEILASLFLRMTDGRYQASDAANDRRELAFMRLLARAPWYRGRPGYYAVERSRLAGNPSGKDASFLARQLRGALAQNKNKVITFERASVRGEDLDRKVGIKSPNVERTYRCVNDECEYCSYEMGRRVCRVVKDYAPEEWEHVRVYKITAAPLVSGGPLVPARGSRFTLADGQTAAKWDYHTATLVVLKREGVHIPLVADKFLAGENPVALTDWMKAFSPGKTMFFVAPFQRSQTVEDAIKTVESRQGNAVKADGYVYQPAPINW